MNPVWGNKELLLEASANSGSLTEMLSYLNINTNSGNYQTLKKYCLLHNVPLPVYDRSQQTTAATISVTTPIEVLFSNRGVKVQGQRLRTALVEHKGREDKCEDCDIGPIWNKKTLVLTVDHIDGDIFNNVETNLRIMCPNCHSQTDNFCGKNIKGFKYNYCLCGTRITKKAQKCVACSKIDQKKRWSEISRYPDMDALYDLYIQMGTMEALAKEFNVSSNAIRKYIRRQGVDYELFRSKSL